MRLAANLLSATVVLIVCLAPLATTAAPALSVAQADAGVLEPSATPPATSAASEAMAAAENNDPSPKSAKPQPLQSVAKAQPNAPLLDDPAQGPKVVRITLILALMAIIPALAVCVTPFVRIIVVLSMIRHAFGMPETPPNQVLISLAIFLTAFAMMPTIEAVNTAAFQPFMAGSISVKDAMDHGSEPLRIFMLRQVHDEDIKTIYDIAKTPLPTSAAQVPLMKLIPAFMLNELRLSFKMGFVIFLPFLLIDLVVSSILLSLGMLMVPPSTISLPIKILMFVLIDGWSLVLQGVVGSIR